MESSRYGHRRYSRERCFTASVGTLMVVAEDMEGSPIDYLSSGMHGGVRSRGFRDKTFCRASLGMARELLRATLEQGASIHYSSTVSRSPSRYICTCRLGSKGASPLWPKERRPRCSGDSRWSGFLCSTLCLQRRDSS